MEAKCREFNWLGRSLEYAPVCGDSTSLECQALTWESNGIALIQIVLTLTLWPTIRNKTSRIPWGTSVPATFGLWALGAIFATMEMWTAVATSWACALAWTFIALYRVDSKEVPSAIPHD